MFSIVWKNLQLNQFGQIVVTQVNETEEAPTKVRRLNEIPRNEPFISTHPGETSGNNCENVVNLTYANNDIAASTPINQLTSPTQILTKTNSQPLS